MTMETEEQMKARIDALSLYDLMCCHRFAPVGDPRMRGAEGEYRILRMLELREQNEAGWTATSKILGW